MTKLAMINFWFNLGYHANYPDQEFGRYGGNKLSWPGRFALSWCSCLYMTLSSMYSIHVFKVEP